MRKNRFVFAVVAVSVFLAALITTYRPASAQIPQKFTNLKVLPQDIPQRELVDKMKEYTFALGTRCWYCHEGEGDDLSTYDFASDKKEHKGVARRHIQMTQEINQKFFQSGAKRVTCNTCHQGQAEID